MPLLSTPPPALTPTRSGFWFARTGFGSLRVTYVPFCLVHFYPSIDCCARVLPFPYYTAMPFPIAFYTRFTGTPFTTLPHRYLRFAVRFRYCGYITGLPTLVPWDYFTFVPGPHVLLPAGLPFVLLFHPIPSCAARTHHRGWVTFYRRIAPSCLPRCATRLPGTLLPVHVVATHPQFAAPFFSVCVTLILRHYCAYRWILPFVVGSGCHCMVPRSHTHCGLVLRYHSNVAIGWVCYYDSTDYYPHHALHCSDAVLHHLLRIHFRRWVLLRFYYPHARNISSPLLFAHFALPHAFHAFIVLFRCSVVTFCCLLHTTYTIARLPDTPAPI